VNAAARPAGLGEVAEAFGSRKLRLLVRVRFVSYQFYQLDLDHFAITSFIPVHTGMSLTVSYQLPLFENNFIQRHRHNAPQWAQHIVVNSLSCVIDCTCDTLLAYILFESSAATSLHKKGDANLE